MTFHAELLDEIETQDTLGEGLVWDHRRGEFIWTDIEGRRFHRYHLAEKRLETRQLPRRLCCFALTRDPNWVFGAFENEIARLNLETADVTTVAKLELPPAVRLNDGRTGPDGALWVGSMVEDHAEAVGTPANAGAMFRITQDGTVQEVFGDVKISNGLCWRPDGRVMYHADSPRQAVRQFSFDPQTGTLGEPGTFITSVDGAYPDGAVTDENGLYCSALWEGSRMQSFDAQGIPGAAVPLPTPLATCPCFGGAKLDLLAVTTAHIGLSDAARETDSRAGNLFIFRTNRTGLRARILGETALG